MGVEASLTGHLVFSMLHTNSAPESITRLLDMGMDPFNFADALLGILAQRTPAIKSGGVSRRLTGVNITTPLASCTSSTPSGRAFHCARIDAGMVTCPLGRRVTCDATAPGKK
jgi:hypothetical protein